MKKRAIKFPPSVQATLWFADPTKIDWQGQKRMIITSVLNRGTWEAVKWIYQFYGKRALREVIAHPQRGLWFQKSLEFWCIFFKLTLKPAAFQKALIQL